MLFIPFCAEPAWHKVVIDKETETALPLKSGNQMARMMASAFFNLYTPEKGAVRQMYAIQV